MSVWCMLACPSTMLPCNVKPVARWQLQALGIPSLQNCKPNKILPFINRSQSMVLWYSSIKQTNTTLWSPGPSPAPRESPGATEETGKNRHLLGGRANAVMWTSPLISKKCCKRWLFFFFKKDGLKRK